jgi:hypothetical protein
MLTDEQVPAVWRKLGLPGLADIHVHFLPPEMLAKVWAYFDRASEALRHRVADLLPDVRR